MRFQGSFKGFSRNFEKCFIEVSRVSQESFKTVSKKTIECLKGFPSVCQKKSSVIQEKLKCVLRELYRGFTGVSKVFIKTSRVLRVSFKGNSRIHQGTFKEASRMPRVFQ